MTAQSAAVRQPIRGAEVVKSSGEEVFNQFSQMHDRVARRAFELSEERGRALGYELADWFRAESELLRPVPLKVIESDGEYIVQAEIPGFCSEDIQIGVERRRVIISANRKPAEQAESWQTIRSEWRADRILRILDLSSDVDAYQVSTTLKDGILAVELPKLRDP